MLKPHYQKFAELFATGVDPVEAYQQSCGQGKSKDACYKGAQRLSKNVHILAEVERIRNQAQLLGGGAIADLKEVLVYLTSVLRTPIGQVSPDSPLCQEYNRKVVEVETEENTQGEQLEMFGPDEVQSSVKVTAIEKIKMPDKLRAIELLGKLERWFAEDRKNDSEADQIDELLDQL